jgi:hypothetical protein
MRRCLRPLASMCFRRGAVDVHTATAAASPVKISVAAASTVHVSVPGEALTAADTGQGLTLVHVRAQLEQLQDTFMSQVGFYGGQRCSSS